MSVNYDYNCSNTCLLLLVITAPEMTVERGNGEENRGREESEGGDGRRREEEGRGGGAEHDSALREELMI